MLDPITFVAPAPPSAGDALSPAVTRANADWAETQRAGRETSARARGAYAAAVSAVEHACATRDPGHLLAQLSYHGLLRTEFEGGECAADRPVMEHHVEILMAFALRVRTPDRTLPRRPEVEALRDALVTATVGHRVRDFAALVAGPNATAGRMAEVREMVRMDRQAVRRVGYPHHVYETALALWAPLDPDLERGCGIRVTGVVRLVRRLLAAVATRVRGHRVALALLGKEIDDVQGSLPGMIEAVGGTFPRAKMAVEKALTELSVRERANNDAVMRAAKAATDVVLLDLLTFTTADLRTMYESAVAPHERGVSPVESAAGVVRIDIDQLRAVLHQWSYAWGDLASRNREHLFLNNPVATHPLIRLGDDRWLLPVPTLPLTYLLELLESLVGATGPLKNTYDLRCATFLESEVARTLSAALDAPAYLNTYFNPPEEPGVRRETDVVVVVDSHLVIAEAKSGAVPEGAGRAGDDLNDVIKDLYEKPATQSAHAARYLSRPHRESYDRKGGGRHTIDTRGVRRTVRLTVTLDRLGTSGARWTTLRDAGLLSSPDAPPTPTMHLWELQLVCDVLTTPSELLHYLGAREMFEGASRLRADEQDLVAFYLRTGFSGHASARLAPDETIWGMSTCLDPYFMQRWSGAHVLRPQRPLSPRWQALLRAFEASRPAGWSRMTEILLDVSDVEQAWFEHNLSRLRDLERRAASGSPVVRSGFSRESFLGARPDAPWELMTVVLSRGLRDDEIDVALRTAAATRGAPDRELLAIAFRIDDLDASYHGVLLAPPVHFGS